MVKSSIIQPARGEAAAPKPQGCTNYKLRQLMRSVTQHYDAEVGLSGLKTTQYSLLSCVLKLGPVRPSVIAQTMRMDASTLTRNLQPLIKQGLLAMSPGEDGRSRLVTLTVEGRALRAEAQRHWRRAQEDLNRKLGVDRVRALHALIDEAMSLLGEGDDDEQS
jgi:DNA-binding MarR family transcriptional regulator